MLGRKRPNAANLIVPGSKAYVKDYNVPKGHKLDPTAVVGYLVGHEATILWRIWIPELKRIIRARDVHFHETQKFNPLQPPVNMLLRQAQLNDYVTSIDIPQLSNPVTSRLGLGGIFDEYLEQTNGNRDTGNVTQLQEDDQTGPINYPELEEHDVQPEYSHLPTPDETPEPLELRESSHYESND